MIDVRGLHKNCVFSLVKLLQSQILKLIIKKGSLGSQHDKSHQNLDRLGVISGKPDFDVKGGFYK